MMIDWQEMSRSMTLFRRKFLLTRNADPNAIKAFDSYFSPSQFEWKLSLWLSFQAKFLFHSSGEQTAKDQSFERDSARGGRCSLSWWTGRNRILLYIIFFTKRQRLEESMFPKMIRRRFENERRETNGSTIFDLLVLCEEMRFLDHGC